MNRCSRCQKNILFQKLREDKYCKTCYVHVLEERNEERKEQERLERIRAEKEKQAKEEAERLEKIAQQNKDFKHKTYPRVISEKIHDSFLWEHVVMPIVPIPFTISGQPNFTRFDHTRFSFNMPNNSTEEFIVHGFLRLNRSFNDQQPFYFCENKEEFFWCTTSEYINNDSNQATQLYAAFNVALEIEKDDYINWSINGYSI